MTWSRFDDNTSESREWEHVSFEARWHYFALVQFCSRGKYWDGVIPYNRALGCSDVPNPEACHEELESIGRVTRNHRTNSSANSHANSSPFVTVTVTRIDEHVPSESVRGATEKAKLRMRRKRAHDLGKHHLCNPEKCPSAEGVTRTVPESVGTGQDRTGTYEGENMQSEADDETQPSPLATCVDCGEAMPLLDVPNLVGHECRKPRGEYTGGRVEWANAGRDVRALPMIELREDDESTTAAARWPLPLTAHDLDAEVPS